MSAATGLEVRVHEGRERAEVTRVTQTLTEVIASLHEIDRMHLLHGRRPTWVVAHMARDHQDLIIRVEARHVPDGRDYADMLVPAVALVAGAEVLKERPEVPKLFTPNTVTRVGKLAVPRDGVQSVSLATYNGVAAHNELRNARRRVARNRSKEAAALLVGDAPRAAMSRRLRLDAEAAVGRYSAEIAARSGVGGVECGRCGITHATADSCAQQSTLDDFRETSIQWRESWSTAEAAAFDTYAGIEHADINARLRRAAPLTHEQTQIVRHLDCMLDRAPQASTAPRTVFRAFGLSAARGDTDPDTWVEQRFRPGETVRFEAFTSTSTDHSVALDFSEARSEHTGGGVFMELLTWQGGFTGDSPENEVLLRRCSEFTVVSTEATMTLNGKHFRRVVLREVKARP
ncbi:MAG: ADP-ribosyltransferase [Propionibacterium sp.]|nr:ADP-ribosyltransferase [Propionibacterium sp.]